MESPAVAVRTTPVSTFVYVVNFYGCTPSACKHPSKEQLDLFVRTAGFSINGESILTPGKTEEEGFAYSAQLYESGISIDGWPERGNAVQVLLHFCNYSQDNTPKARGLLAFLHGYFNPSKNVEFAPLEAPI